MPSRIFSTIWYTGSPNILCSLVYMPSKIYFVLSGIHALQNIWYYLVNMSPQSILYFLSACSLKYTILSGLHDLKTIWILWSACPPMFVLLGIWYIWPQNMLHYLVYMLLKIYHIIYSTCPAKYNKLFGLEALVNIVQYSSWCPWYLLY